jgi:hypothetical protein
MFRSLCLSIRFALPPALSSGNRAETIAPVLAQKVDVKKACKLEAPLGAARVSPWKHNLGSTFAPICLISATS